MDLNTSNEVTEKICNLFDTHEVEYKIIFHPECRTSAESTEARIKGGGGYVIGAKAILMKVECKKNGNYFDVFVLPGINQIDSKIIKKYLKNRYADFNKFRFSTADEMANITGGLVPGTMPPFGSKIFENLNHLYIESSLLDYDVIGFNAACLTQSLIVPCKEYIQLAFPTDIFPFAKSSI